MPAVCRILLIPMPMLEHKEGDDLDQFVAELPEEKRARALAALRLVFSE